MINNEKGMGGPESSEQENSEFNQRLAEAVEKQDEDVIKSLMEEWVEKHPEQKVPYVEWDEEEKKWTFTDKPGKWGNSGVATLRK